MRTPSVARSSVLSALLLCTILTPSFTRAAATHDTAWCQQHFICTNPTLYYVLYSQINTDYACACSAGTSGCFGAGGYIYCAYATLAMQNCVSWPVGETAAANAGTEYGYCSACANGYQLSLAPRPSPACWACSAAISNCATCSGNGVCSGCTNGYQLFPKQNVCGKCAANCQSCSSPNTCDVCNTGYTASADKTTCFSCSITGCSACTPEGICGSCASQYTLSADQKTCYECNMTGCASCSADNVCTQCATGYTLSSDENICFSCSMSHCSACTADDTCDMCEHGYTLKKDGSCAKDDLAWWVWLIVGLGAALVVAAVIILVVCCCRRRKDTEETLQTPEQPAAVPSSAYPKSVANDSRYSDYNEPEQGTSMSSIGRPMSQRARRVSIGGETVLGDAHPGLPQFVNQPSPTSWVENPQPFNTFAPPAEQVFMNQQVYFPFNPFHSQSNLSVYSNNASQLW